MILSNGLSILLVVFVCVSSAIAQENKETKTEEIATAEQNSTDTTSDAEPTGPKLTGDPQKDYIHDPNLPIELSGYDLSDYPFYKRVPKEGHNFTCDGRHDGFYASVPHKCQVYYNCLFSQRYDFLCANYTVFDQVNFICHYASEVDCANSERFYDRNEELYVTTTTTTQAPKVIYVDRRRPRPRPLNPLRSQANRVPPRRRLRPGLKQKTTTPLPAAESEYYDYYDQNYYDDYNDYYQDEPAGQTTTTTTTTTTPKPLRRRPGNRPGGGERRRPLRRRRPGNDGGRRRAGPGGRRRIKTTTTTQSPEYDYYYDDDYYYYDDAENEAVANDKAQRSDAIDKQDSPARREQPAAAPLDTPAPEEPQPTRRSRPGQIRRPNFKRSQSTVNSSGKSQAETENPDQEIKEEPVTTGNDSPSPNRPSGPSSRPINSRGVIDDAGASGDLAEETPAAEEPTNERPNTRRRRPSRRFSQAEEETAAPEERGRRPSGFGNRRS